MATQAGSVFIGLDLSAAGFNTKFDLATRKITGFGGIANANLARVAAQSRLTSAELARLNSLNFTKITGSVAALGSGIKGLAGIAGIGIGASELIKYSEAAIRVSNALKVAGLSGQEMTTVYNALFQSAQKNAAPLEALATLYGRVSLVQGELGISTQQLLGFTDKIALALRVSGKSAQESSGALLQLSQALGSGTVRAEEFNSILEGALPIAQAAAAGLLEAGGSVSKLRQLVVDGRVPSQAFFRAFEAGSVILQTKVVSATETAAQATIRFQNVMIDSAGKVDAVFKLTEQFTKSLGSLSAAIEIAASRAGEAKGPFDEFALALGGARSEAEGLFGWISKINRLNVTNNVAKYAAHKMVNLDRTSPALPPLEYVDDGTGGNPVPMNQRPYPDESGRGLAVARFKPKVDPVSIKQFLVTSSGDTKSGLKSEADAFLQSAAAIERRTAVLQADLATVGMSQAARDRARIIADLETAAVRANTEAGMSNTEVTAEQRDRIDSLASAYENVKSRIEAANSPLQQWIRDSANVRENLEGIAVSGLDRIADEMTAVTTGAKSASDAMKSLADVVIREVQKMIIKMALAALLKAFIGQDGGESGGLGLTGIKMPFSGGIGGMGGGGGFLGNSGIGLDSFFASAKGNAFGPTGKITGFKYGGVFNTPTLFNFAKGGGFNAGVLGEAGPETILPLTRGKNGKLGVHAIGAGGGGDMKVIINNNSSAQISKERRPNESGGFDLVVMIEDIVAGKIGGGDSVINQALQNRYGVDPTRGMAS